MHIFTALLRPDYESGLRRVNSENVVAEYEGGVFAKYMQEVYCLPGHGHCHWSPFLLSLWYNIRRFSGTFSGAAAWWAGFIIFFVVHD